MTVKSKIKKLNLGSGDFYLDGYTNVDIRDNCKTDIKWDLNNYPYPFKDNEFDECLLDMVLGAGIYDCIKCIKEVSRIVKKGGKIIIIGTHALAYSSLSGLYQHNIELSENTFIDIRIREFELENYIKLINQEFIYVNKWKKYIPFKKYLKIFLRGLYDDLRFEFEVIKD